MTDATDPPVFVMPHAVLADLELGLVGALPVGHVLRGPFRPVEGDAAGEVPPPGEAAPSVSGRDVTPQVSAEPNVGIRLDRHLPEQVRAAGSLILVDEEQTPLGRLEVLETAAGPDESVIAFGSLHPERRRESGADRGLALDLSPDRALQDLVVVVRRPPLYWDVDVLTDAVAACASGPGSARVLLVVPDHHSDTAGVPTHLMTVLAERLGARVGGRASIATLQLATAPMARRGGGGDAVHDAPRDGGRRRDDRRRPRDRRLAGGDAMTFDPLVRRRNGFPALARRPRPSAPGDPVAAVFPDGGVAP